MLQSKSLCGVTLQYNIEGDGYPVILMHGWGCNHTTVQSIERLLSPHFKVYNLDFPGFGGSSTPPSIWGVEEYTQMLEAFIKDENIEFLSGTLSGDGYLSYTPHETKPIKLFWLMLPGLSPNAH